MPSLLYGENLFVVIAVLPLIMYQVANIYGGNTVLEALPPENMCLTAYVGLLGISYLGLNASKPAAGDSSYGSFLGVSILTIVAGWFQVPDHGVLMSKNTSSSTTVLFHLALHLLVLAIVAQPNHKVGTAGIAVVTSLLLSFASPRYSLLDDVSSILALMAGFMTFHYFESRHLKSHTTNSNISNKEPWEQRLVTHISYGALFAAFVYFMASDVVAIVKQPQAWYQGLVKIVSAICIVALGFKTGGAVHSSDSSSSSNGNNNPFDKSSRTESLPLAATLLDLSGTPIAVTNANMEIKIFSKAFRNVLDPRHERHDLKGTALDRAMNLSSVDSIRLQRCFDECKSNSTATLSDADSTFVLRNDVRVQVDVSLMAEGMEQPENRGFAVILKSVVPAGASTSVSTSPPQGIESNPNGLPTAR